MSMTKAEKARMEALEMEAAQAKALCFPPYPVPTPMTKDEIKNNLVLGGVKYGTARQKVARGWFANTYSMRVTYGCSDGTHHSPYGDATGSQGMGQMFRTEVEAWAYIRHVKTREYAGQLLKIDEALKEAARRVSK